MSEVTRILQSLEQGNPRAAEELLPLVYEELRKLAVAKMVNEAAGHTLQPTALVHEAWLRLTGDAGPVRFTNCGHFFAAAAEAMRRILIDSARRKEAQKRGAGLQRVDLEDADVAAKADGTTLLRMDEALEKLAREDPPAAELVKLRFFGGLTNEQAAATLGISVRTAKRYWAFARAWLYDELRLSSGR
ncbi:MAG TPA: sigma-70 family RNA polymerase sigma factor [Verrucomicrobiae bacterium]